MSDPPRPAEDGGRAAPWLWFGVVAVVFAPGLGGEFLNWDDADWISANPLVIDPDRARWLDIWTAPCLGSYYPVYLSVARVLWGISTALGGWVAEHPGALGWWERLGGPAGPFHAASLLGFAGAAALWHEVLRRMGIGAAGRTLAVAWFALHPLRVESVVWVAALRDVLSLGGVLAALWLHLSPRERDRRWLAPLAFAVALLSKSMVFALAPLPLLIDVLWFRRGWRESLGASVPYLVLGAGAVVASYLAFQPLASVNLYPAGDLLHSLPVIGATQLRYLWLQLWPGGLAAIPTAPAPSALGWLALIAGVAALAACVELARRGRRGPLLVAALYVLPMLPVSGLLPLAWQVADRYTLLPSLGLTLALGWLASQPWEDRIGAAGAWIERAVTPLTAGAAAAFAVVTLLTIPHWRTSEALWERSLALYPREWAAHLNYAGVVGGQNRLDDALHHLELASYLAPDRDLEQDRITQLMLFAELLLDQVPLENIGDIVLRFDDVASEARTLTGLSVDLATMGLADPAERVLRRAVAKGAPPQAPYLVHGTLAGRGQDWARSAYLAGRGLLIAPGDANLMTLQAMALLQLGQSAAALRIAEQLAERVPDGDPQAILREIAGLGQRPPAGGARLATPAPPP